MPALDALGILDGHAAHRPAAAVDQDAAAWRQADVLQALQQGGMAGAPVTGRRGAAG